MAKALTVKAIEQLRAATARREIPDGLLSGLYLIVQPSGVKSWAVRYRFEGRPRKYTIGPYPRIELSAARDLARKALVAVAEGRDPSAEKKAARYQHATRDTVEGAIALYIERHAKANTREATWRETERLLQKEVLARWRGRAVQSITKRDVIELLDPVIDRGAPITANRVLGKLKAFFSWANQRGIVEASPCAAIQPPTAEQSRDRVLGDAEISLLCAATDELGFAFGPFVRTLLLTGQRRDEVAGMRWAEIDLARALWTIPRERVKTGNANDVPLSPQLLAILSGLPRLGRGDGHVFSMKADVPFSGFSKSKARLDAAMTRLNRGEALDRWTLHDLRRTTSTGMARLGISLPVIEKVLNHTSGSFGGIVGVYQRHSYLDEKRHALTTWGQFIDSLTAAEKDENRRLWREKHMGQSLSKH